MKNVFLLSRIMMFVFISFLAQSTFATVITVKKEGATFMNLYAWKQVGTEYPNNAPWPGVSMVSQGNGVFTYDLDDAYLDFHLIANIWEKDGDPQVNLPSPTGGTCFEWKGSLATYCGVEPGKGYTIRFRDGLKWGAMNVYSYSPELFGGWPGAALAKYTTDNDGYDWYTLNLPETTVNVTVILFNPANDPERASELLFGPGGYPLDDRCYSIDVVGENPPQVGCPAAPTTKQAAVLNAIFTVYPNPVVDIITINSEVAINSIAVKNTAGQTLLISTGNTADLSQLATGFYIVEAQLADGTIAVQKILKK